MKYQGIDTSARITPRIAQILKQEDISFAVRYLVPNNDKYGWKALTKEEVQAIHDAGLSLMLCWETDAKRMKGGAEAGKADATVAVNLAQEMGASKGTIIYFAADYTVPESDYKFIWNYLYAASMVIGPYQVGLYGSENIVASMSERNVCQYFWQCVGGSNKFLPCANVIQYEWQGGANAKEIAKKIGVAVDLNSAESLAGMWQPEPNKSMSECLDALKWAYDFHIISEDMTDVAKLAVMLYRYHRIFSAEDNKNSSGLLE